MSKLITPPAVEPVTLAEFKEHARIALAVAGGIPVPDEDSMQTVYLKGARQAAENLTGRALITQVWETKFDEFDNDLELPYPILQAVDEVRYLDSNGTEQVLDDTVYRVLTDDDMPGEITLDYNQSWPDVHSVREAVTVKFTAGYGDTASDVPDLLRLAILKLAAEWNNNREETVPAVSLSSVPYGVRFLLAQHRIHYL